MSIRLYDSAWVLLRDVEEPLQVRKDATNPAVFVVGGFRYDIDARPFYVTEATPDIVVLLSMEEARQRGLSTSYTNVKQRYPF
jgi:hypothetical protein